MENSASKNFIPKLEALLFIYGEPIDIKKIAKTLNSKEESIMEGLKSFEEELKREERGLALVWDKNKVQLASKPDFSKLLEDITKQEFTEILTPAALETLSIVIYASPITRANIEYIRGVNSSFILRVLLMRGLVEREVDPKRSNAYVYSASFELLRYLGISKNENLPEFQKYKDLVLNLYKELQDKDKKQQQRQLDIDVQANNNETPSNNLDINNQS